MIKFRKDKLEIPKKCYNGRVQRKGRRQPDSDGLRLSAKEFLIFTAKTTPQLRVKFAGRISAGFPFFFPPFYWKKNGAKLIWVSPL